MNNGPDTQPPTQPGTLTATAVSGGEVDLAWGASSDNVGVSGYQLERCQGSGCSNFAQIATPTGTSYKDTSVSPSTSYSYRVRASDGTNLSSYSNIAGATTPTPDTQAPTQPGTLTATAVSASEIDLAWGASSDNVGVSGYQLERCQGSGCSNFAQIATPTGTSYKDTGLSSVHQLQLPGPRQRRQRQPEQLLEHRRRQHPRCPERSGRGLRLRRGLGDDGRGRVGERQHGHDHGGDLGGDRQVRQGAAVQRLERARHGPRRGLAAPLERDDARGVGQPLGRQRQLA